MSTVLVVGKIEDPNVEAAALSVAADSQQLPRNLMGRIKKSEISWVICESYIMEIDCLNMASISLFLRHAAELEGIRTEERIKGTKWPQLPDYEQTYWLPIEFTKPQVKTEYGGFPILIGSAQALLLELEEIRVLSAHSLGVKPSGFENNSENTLDTTQTLQWVWFALKTGAEKAIAENAPLFIN